jgi:hypothetical protein
MHATLIINQFRSEKGNKINDNNHLGSTDIFLFMEYTLSGAPNKSHGVDHWLHVSRPPWIRFCYEPLSQYMLYSVHGFLHLKLCDANKKQKLNNAAIGKKMPQQKTNLHTGEIDA